MDLWMTKGDGGILPQTQAQDAWIQKHTRTDPVPDGTAPCRFCSQRFESPPNAVFHERQKHKAFLAQTNLTLNYHSSQSDTEPTGEGATGAVQNVVKTSPQQSSPVWQSPAHTHVTTLGRLGGQAPPPTPGNIKPVASRSLNPNPHANWNASFRAGSQNMMSSGSYTTSGRSMRTRSSMLKEECPLNNDTS
jgi:hypothetical protein